MQNIYHDWQLSCFCCRNRNPSFASSIWHSLVIPSLITLCKSLKLGRLEIFTIHTLNIRTWNKVKPENKLQNLYQSTSKKIQLLLKYTSTQNFESYNMPLGWTSKSLALSLWILMNRIKFTSNCKILSLTTWSWEKTCNENLRESVFGHRTFPGTRKEGTCQKHKWHIYKYQKYPSPCTKIFATRNELQQHSLKLQKDIAINGNDYGT